MNKGKIISMIAILSVLIIGILYINFHPTVAVLCYHNVASAKERERYPEEKNWIITIDNFEEQLKFLKDNDYQTLTMQEFYDWKMGKINLPYKSVLITFDDGFLSNAYYAIPLLKKYEMNATLFVVGEYIEKSTETEWKEDVKTYLNKNLLEQIRDNFPNIEIYSHSYGLHEDGAIESASVENLREDIRKFNANIKNSDVYSYPLGKYNNNMIQALKQEGIVLAFKDEKNQKNNKKVTRDDDNYAIPRINVSQEMDIWQLAFNLLMPF